MAVFLIMFAAVTSRVGGATFNVTTPGQQTLTNKFLPYAGSGTQLIGNSPAWRDSAGVLGINNYLEGLETLTPGAAVNLNFSTRRTKRITLNQNTVFTAINIPSVSTNVQTMLLEVIGDGAFTVSFANVTFQTPTITTPDAGVVTLYALRGDSGAVKGYTQAITATGIGPLTVGYVPVANATNNVTDSILSQVSTNKIKLSNNGFDLTFSIRSDTHGMLEASSGELFLNNTVLTGSLIPIVSNFYDNGGPTSGAYWKEQGSLTNYVKGFKAVGGEAYLNTHHTGTNGAVVFNSYSSGIAGPPRDFLFASNETTIAKIGMNSGYTGAGTLFLSDDGTYKAGSGFSLWSSSSGNLTPSPAVDVVSIQSQSADNATNNVLIVDTGSNWVTAGAKLQAWRRNGTNLMAFGIGPTGSSILSLGDNSSVIRTQIEGGTGDYAEVFTLGTSQYGYDLYADGSESYFELRAGGAGKLKFYPAAIDGVVPYIFDTSVSHTSTNLLEIANNGTNKVTVDYSGNVTASAFTPDLQTVSYASSVTVDFSGRSSLWTVLAGDITLASANLAVGRRIEYRIDNQQATNCNVILPSGWRFVSGVVTNVLAASKIGLLTARSYSTTDTNVVAMWSSE